MRWTVHSLNTSRGTTLEEFLDGLSDDAVAEAEALVEMLEEHGNKLRLPISKPLGDGLFEARGLTTGVRLFFVFAPGHRIVVLDGYVKKRTSIPARIMARIRKTPGKHRKGAAQRGRQEQLASRIMQRTPTNADSPEEPVARATTISGPVLPGLQGRRSPEQAARIATKRHLLEFVQMLETRRAELGLSRSAIARQLGVTQPTISRLFSGHVQNIELKTMVRVAEVLNSDLEFVIKPRPPLRSGA